MKALAAWTEMSASCSKGIRLAALVIVLAFPLLDRGRGEVQVRLDHRVGHPFARQLVDHGDRAITVDPIRDRRQRTPGGDEPLPSFWCHRFLA
jgi:hypothetical protein